MSSKIGMLCVSLGIMDIYIYIYECKRCKKVKLNNSFHMLSWVSLQDLPIFQTMIQLKGLKRGWEVVLTVCATVGWQRLAKCGSVAPECSGSLKISAGTASNPPCDSCDLRLFDHFWSFSRFWAVFPDFNCTPFPGLTGEIQGPKVGVYGICGSDIPRADVESV